MYILQKQLGSLRLKKCFNISNELPPIAIHTSLVKLAVRHKLPRFQNLVDDVSHSMIPDIQPPTFFFHRVVHDPLSKLAFTFHSVTAVVACSGRPRAAAHPNRIPSIPNGPMWCCGHVISRVHWKMQSLGSQ